MGDGTGAQFFMPPAARGEEEEEGGHGYITPAQQKARDAAARALRESQARLALAEKEEYLKTRKWRESALFGAGPETMTSDDYETIHDVRRNIWTGGFSGFAAGLFAAAVGSLSYPALQQRGALGPLAKAMEPRHRTAALLISAALGMAVGASTAGQRNSWRMTDIYSRGAEPALTPYQKALREGDDGGARGKQRPGDGGHGSGEDLDSDQRLREWGWDPVKNVPSVSQSSIVPVRQSVEITNQRFADNVGGNRAGAPFEAAHSSRPF